MPRHSEDICEERSALGALGPSGPLRAPWPEELRVSGCCPEEPEQSRHMWGSTTWGSTMHSRPNRPQQAAPPRRVEFVKSHRPGGRSVDLCCTPRTQAYSLLSDLVSTIWVLGKPQPKAVICCGCHAEGGGGEQVV